MSQTNLSLFLEKVAGNQELQAKIAEAKNGAYGTINDRLSALATEVGTPVTAEEFQDVLAEGAELSEADLEGVTGGAGAMELVGSIAKVGVGLLKSVING